MQTQRIFNPDERIPFSLTVQQYNILVEQLYRAVPVIPVVIDMMMQVQSYSPAKPATDADVIVMPTHPAAE